MGRKDEQSLNQRKQVIDLTLSESDSSQGHKSAVLPRPRKRSYADFDDQHLGEVSHQETEEDSQESSISTWTETRRSAYDAMLNQSGGSGWAGLLSTSNNHTRPEEELGEVDVTDSGC